MAEDHLPKITLCFIVWGRLKDTYCPFPVVGRLLDGQDAFRALSVSDSPPSLHLLTVTQISKVSPAEEEGCSLPWLLAWLALC